VRALPTENPEFILSEFVLHALSAVEGSEIEAK
jgi:hypothetical protein